MTGPFSAHLKLSQHCKSGILQYKIKKNFKFHFKNVKRGNSLTVQWLGLCASTAGVPEFIHGQETNISCAAEQLSTYAPTTEPTS